MGSADNRLYAITPDGKQKWALTTGSWVVGSPAIICPTCLLAQTEKRAQKAVKVDKIHVEYDLYKDGELVLSDIVEVSPKFLSEDFRNSIIQKMEYPLLDMVEKRGPMAQTELPAAVLEKLEKKLTTGVGERNGSKGGPVRAALNTVLIFRQNASCQNCVTPLNFITYLLISPGSAPVKGSWKTLTVSLLKPLTVKSLSVTRTLLRL